MVAVLFLPFNRPEKAKLVVKAMLQNPPTRLYIGADGPRPANPEDKASCAQVRDLLSSTAWPCEVFTLYQNENLGCSQAITRHLDWFFSHEDRGVILEDDCVPHPRFLDFCSTLLDRHELEPRIMSVSGFTPFTERQIADASYWFSVFCLSWGWATWKRAWALYRPRMEGLDDFLASGRFPGAASDPLIAARWTDRFRLAQRDPNYSWFVNWTYSCWTHGGLSVMPDANLVRNVGLADGLKLPPTLPSPGADVPYGLPEWPLRHPRTVKPDPALDQEFMRVFFHL